MKKLSYEEQLNIALSANMKNNHDQGLSSLNNVCKLLFLICHEYNRFEKIQVHEFIEKPEISNKIKEHINVFIKEGYEPSFTLGPIWWQAVLCECFALIKHSPALWSLFDEDEKNRITQLMKMYAYMWNFGCNDNNNYGTGWNLAGNYGKWRGPNYRLSNNLLILFIIDFFGGIDNVNDLFLNFDYDNELKKLKEYNFKNALFAWITPTFKDENDIIRYGAKDLLEKGGDAYIADTTYGFQNYYKRGSGQGVKIPIAYHDSIPYGIIHALYNNCFSGGPCISSVTVPNTDYECKIKDDTLSPVEGQEGMMLEFNMINDGLGLRSSLLHCITDFLLVSGMVVACWFLRISKLQVYKNYKKIQVGITDFLYKYSHGYKSWCLGRPESLLTDNLDSVILWGNYWAEHYDINLYEDKEN